MFNKFDNTILAKIIIYKLIMNFLKNFNLLTVKNLCFIFYEWNIIDIATVAKLDIVIYNNIYDQYFTRFLTELVQFIHLDVSIEDKVIFIHKADQNLHFIWDQNNLILLTNSFIIVFEMRIKYIFWYLLCLFERRFSNWN